MRLITWNPWVGQDPPDLRENLLRLLEDHGRPVALSLQEVKRWRGTLPGYQRVAADAPWRRLEAASTTLLVRDDVDIVTRGCLDVGGPTWKGPHGEVHLPRIYPWALVRHHDQPIRQLPAHRAPGGPRGRNRGAWAAEHAAILSWVRQGGSHAARPSVVFGDLNGRAWDRHRLGLRALAREAGGELLLRGIDGGIAVGATGTARKVADLYGSDHHRPVILHIWAGRD